MKTVQKKLSEIAEIKAKFEILTDAQQAKVKEEEKLKQEAQEIQAKLNNMWWLVKEWFVCWNQKSVVFLVHVTVSCFLVCILLENSNVASANQNRFVIPQYGTISFRDHVRRHTKHKSVLYLQIIIS